MVCECWKKNGERAGIWRWRRRGKKEDGLGVCARWCECACDWGLLVRAYGGWSKAANVQVGGAMDC